MHKIDKTKSETQFYCLCLPIMKFNMIYIISIVNRIIRLATLMNILQ